MLLYHEHERGHIACAPVKLAGISVGERHYEILGHLVEVDGAGEPLIMQADVDELLRSGVFRLATAREQNQHASRVRKASSLEEKRGE